MLLSQNNMLKACCDISTETSLKLSFTKRHSKVYIAEQTPSRLDQGNRSQTQLILWYQSYILFEKSSLQTSKTKSNLTDHNHLHRNTSPANQNVVNFYSASTINQKKVEKKPGPTQSLLSSHHVSATWISWLLFTKLCKQRALSLKAMRQNHVETTETDYSLTKSACLPKPAKIHEWKQWMSAKTERKLENLLG